MKYGSVVISGLPGSGKGALARKLAEETGLKIVSIGELWRKQHRERHPNNEISFEDYWKSIDINEQRKMDNYVRELISEGNYIGDFRFAKSCEGLDALFVFLTAELDIRAKRAMNVTERYKGKVFDEIKKILEKREEDEVNIGKEIYDSKYDYRDLGFYHFVLDSGELKLAEEVEIVKQILNGKEIKEAIRSLNLS